MGIELPPELADVAAQAGVAWPQADEEAMATQAQAWRDAATSMTTLTTDADNTVRTTLNAVQGDTGTAASQHWQAFVEPDSGHLTSTVRGMTDAADRLDHAAQQVGTAKVEIVRNLVSLAQNADAANNAAAAGHPMALAGLDTAVRGTSANVAHIETNLISAVQPASGVDMSAVTPPVNANPGAHLLDPATTLLTDTTTTVTDTGQRATDLVGNPGQQATALVGDTGQQVTALVGDTGQRATDLVGDTGQRATTLVGDTGQRATDLVGGGYGPGHGVVGDVVPGTGGGARDIVDGVVGQVPGDRLDLHPGDPVTGPVPIAPSLDVPGWPHDDRPTPPTGTTVQAGFDSAPAVPANIPPTAPPIAGVPAPGAPGGQPGFAGGGPTFGGGPAVGGGPVGGIAPAPGPVPGAGAAAGAAAGGAKPAPAQPGVVGGQPSSGQPPAGAKPGTQFGTGQPAPGQPGAVTGQPGTQQPGTQQPGAQQGLAKPGLGQPGQAVTGQPGFGQPGAGQPSAHPQSASPQPSQAPDYPGQPVVRERDETLALFWVHMFPIGHMPVAADRPARQVPPPREELDYAAGMRFEPGDHPRSDLVDSADRRAALREGAPLVTSAEPLTRDDVTHLAEGHDPLGGENERDWDRRYQVRFGRVTAEGIRPDGLEFAWPPGEQYPEGGSAAGEAEVLDEGAELDRFGSPAGRVFAEAGTRFAQRSLPPAHLDQGYRRYRVLRPLPVWRAVSAAWFAQPGGGIRYRTTQSAIELVALGYLADITREEA